MRIYVSGPMTGLPEFNFPAFNAASDLLRAAGFEVENPADKGIIKGWAWEDYMRYDLRVLMDCQGMALLPGYQTSRGALLELYVAEALAFQVLSVDNWLLKVGQLA